MRLFNSLTRKLEEFVPINPPDVGMYTCGPTVYDFATIGNFRTYTSADIFYRFLIFSGYKVKYIMNLTDVGHLTGDNSGNADMGEDRMEKAASRDKKSAWDIAKFYTEAFMKDFEKLNLLKPYRFVKATDHIQEQIDLIKRLEKNGLTYRISDGIYFDSRKLINSGNRYYEMSDLDKIKEGARVEINSEKRNPTDFALWKFSPKKSDGKKRDMEWDSIWGVGFPGWHIECSAMSMKYLGETFDIHFGGEDLRSIHHPNEIAQSEGATGKKFVNYWIHGAFLKVNGGRMGKSLGNAYTLTDIEKKGYSPLDLRYFYLTAKYNQPLNFSWEALDTSKKAFDNLKQLVKASRNQNQRTVVSGEKIEKVDYFRDKFILSLNDNLNVPQAIAVLWEILKSNIPSEDKYDLAMSLDEVLGLKLNQLSVTDNQIPKNIEILIAERNKLRKERKFKEADEIRDKVHSLGFKVKDTPIS